MISQIKSNNAEQPLLGTEHPPALIVRFRILPLCCLILLFLFQLVVLLGPNWPESYTTILAAIQVFGLATVGVAFAFNRLQLSSNENDATKTVWALKYLWEIKSNVAMYFLLFCGQVYLDIEHQRNEIATTCIEDYYEEIREVTLFSFPIIVLVLTILFFLHFGFVAHQISSKLKSKQQQQQLCATQLMFTGFQIAVKICIFATLSLPNLQSLADSHQTFGLMVILGGIFYFTYRSSVKNLLWTPSPTIFESTEIQSQIVEETLGLYIGSGIVVLIGQTFGMWLSVTNVRYWEITGLGLIYVRILHLMLCVLMNVMASKVNNPQVGVRYLIVDVVLAVLCFFLVISLALYSFRSPTVETSFFVAGVMVYIAIKVGLFVTLTVRQLQKQSELANDNNAWQTDFKYLIGWLSALFVGTWVYAYLYERSRDELSIEFGMTLFWLVSLVGMGHLVSTKQSPDCKNEHSESGTPAV